MIAAGVQDDVLEAVDDSDSPKEALIELIVASAKAAAAAEFNACRYSVWQTWTSDCEGNWRSCCTLDSSAAALDSKVASVESKLSSRIDGCVTEVSLASRQLCCRGSGLGLCSAVWPRADSCWGRLCDSSFNVQAVNALEQSVAEMNAR